MKKTYKSAPALFFVAASFFIYSCNGCNNNNPNSSQTDSSKAGDSTTKMQSDSSSSVSKADTSSIGDTLGGRGGQPDPTGTGRTVPPKQK